MNHYQKQFYFHGGNRQMKATALIAALEAHGWHGAITMSGCDIFFADVDKDTQYMDTMHRSGKRIFLYPHAARPNLFNDFGSFPIYPHVTAGFQMADGHVEILRRIGVEYPIEVIGWFYCPMRPFQPRDSFRNVLFAPIHPNSDNSLSDVDQQINKDTFKRLLSLVKAAEIKLTVRFVRKLENNGLWKIPGVKYIQGEPKIDYSQIDGADVVVSHQTFAYLAIARGVPTVMMGEDVPPRVGSPIKKDFRFAKTWNNYRDLLMYPLDILAVDDVRALLQIAISDDSMIADWRSRLIGKPFDPAYFVQRVESYLQ
jgi:hypothetical protein